MLAHTYTRLREDVRTALETDPAARSVPTVLLYAGLHAVWLHRLGHHLWETGHPFLARLCSQVSRFLTGVEIHPAAELGRRVFIDHGMGVVVGETAAIGDDVTLYHGVTLGGDDPRPVKRHPTVADGVTLGANSTLVGDITIGEDATVGAGAVVVDDVPPETTVAGNPARPVRSRSDATEPESHRGATGQPRGRNDCEPRAMPDRETDPEGARPDADRRVRGEEDRQESDPSDCVYC